MNRKNVQMYFGKTVRVVLKDPKEEYVCKVVQVTDLAVLLKGRGVPAIVELARITAIITATTGRVRLHKRKLRRLRDDDSAKQHLVDRHGLFFDLASRMSEDDARTYHGKVDHSLLGHAHVGEAEQEVQLDEYDLANGGE